MSRHNKKTSCLSHDEHIETLGELLSQLTTHLIVAAEKKGTWAITCGCPSFTVDHATRQTGQYSSAGYKVKIRAALTDRSVAAPGRGLARCIANIIANIIDPRTALW
jgi:hypothetical protein